MKKVNIPILSFIFGLIVSLFLTTLIIIFGGLFIGIDNTLDAGLWLFTALVLPTTLCFAVLGNYFYTEENLENKKIWKVTIFSVLFISLLSGTWGTIMSDLLFYGSTGINLKDRIYWGIMYSLYILPVTLLFGKLMINIFIEFISKLKTK